MLSIETDDNGYLDVSQTDEYCMNSAIVPNGLLTNNNF